MQLFQLSKLSKHLASGNLLRPVLLFPCEHVGGDGRFTLVLDIKAVSNMVSV